MIPRQVFFAALACGAVLALAGCGYWQSLPRYHVYGTAPADSIRGQCERAAYDDPEMKAAVANEAVQANYSQQEALRALERVKRQVVARCLRQHGVRDLNGGVERPLP